MRSNFDENKLYVVCFACAMAELVESRRGAATLMLAHEGAKPGHKQFHYGEGGPISVQFGWGSTMNRIAQAIKDDQREVSVSMLERAS